MKKKILLGLLFGFFFLLIRPTHALAVGCLEYYCTLRTTTFVCDEGKKLTCQPGSQAGEGEKICCGGTWSNPGESCQEIPGASCSEPGALNSSYAKFVQAIKEGRMEMRTWLNGTEGEDPEKGYTGMVSALFNSFTYAIGQAKTSSNETGSTGGGAIGSLAGLIGGMYEHKPASSAEYIAYVGQNMGIVKSAYAQGGQGIGWSGLHSLIPVWRIFRNASYMIFIIIFIVIGFAIMFRVKLDPQTVIGIQNALPKLILTLLLITFSYAIAGLVIDFIYVAIRLVIALAGGNFSLNYNQSIFSMAGDAFGNLFYWETSQGAATAISIFVKDAIGGFAGGFLGVSVDVLGAFILSVALLFSLFKIFFILLISYISLITATIFSPFLLIVEAFPGQKGFSNWLKLLLSNAIVFPATVAMIALSKIIFNAAESNAGGLWVAPGIGNNQTNSFLPFVIGFGFILATPTVLNTVKQAISGDKGLGALGGAAIQQATAGFVPIRAAFKGIGAATQPFTIAGQKIMGERFIERAFPRREDKSKGGRGKGDEKRGR